MSRLLADGCVLNKVLRGYDGQSAIQRAGRPDECLVDGVARSLVLVDLLYHLLAALASVGYVSLQLVPVERIISNGIAHLATLEDPAPRGPSPDAEGCGEEVVVRRICLFLMIKTCNHRDAFIVLIAIEHLLTEWDKRQRRRGVVFQHDDLLCQRESPRLSLMVRQPGT